MKYILIVAIVLISSLAQGQAVQRIKVAALDSMIREAKGPLMVNFWATYCMPCLEELPVFKKLQEKYNASGLKLWLVSLDLEEDYPLQIEKFVAKRNIPGTQFWLDEYNADYFLPVIDSSWSGAIPGTLFINNEKGIRVFREQQFTEKQLEKEIMAILGKN